MTDEMLLGQGFYPVLHLSPVTIIPLMIHNLFNLKIALIRRTSGRSLWTCKYSIAFSCIEDYRRERERERSAITLLLFDTSHFCRDSRQTDIN